MNHTDAQILEAISRIFAHQRLGVLASCGGKQAYASLVAFAASKDLKKMYFCTGKATRKYQNLIGDPQVSLLVDNRTNQISDFAEAWAVTAVGMVDFLNDAEMHEFEDVYLGKHPYLKGFAKAPGTRALRLRVESYFVVRRFQQVTELRVGS
jgi:nitroimidazol reductase NimA-like FMN-containing flavoprotein (pyridoxamine 5'-phosphate oxidase superfamily)